LTEKTADGVDIAIWCAAADHDDAAIGREEDAVDVVKGVIVDD